jgi:hypothetical protein
LCPRKDIEPSTSNFRRIPAFWDRFAIVGAIGTGQDLVKTIARSIGGEGARCYFCLILNCEVSFFRVLR